MLYIIAYLVLKNIRDTHYTHKGNVAIALIIFEAVKSIN